MTFQTNELWRYKRNSTVVHGRKLTSTLQRSVFSIRLHKFAFAVDSVGQILEIYLCVVQLVGGCFVEYVGILKVAFLLSLLRIESVA